jgi:molybdate transport system ATP-binding protein
MIVLRGVHTIRSGQQIFQDFSWKISPNDNWVITGPNGSGKTALLEVLAGQQFVQKGSVEFDFVKGETWEDQFQERRRLIQYIPAQAAHALLPANSDVYYQQRYYSLGDEYSTVQVRDILSGDLHHFQSLDIPPTFNINPLLDREVKRLSNGQLKKVLILQRLLNHLPRLLLLDYPFEGLDRDSRKDLCDFIDFIAGTYSIQVVIVDQGHELPKCITRCLTMNDLRIEKEGEIGKHVISSLSADREKKVASTGEVVVAISNLKIQYGDTVILENFNWTIRRGDRWALVGANGSGKTTVFSIIFADHPMAYSQEVYLFGQRRGTGESIWDIKRRIHYLGPELISYLDTQTTNHSARQYIMSAQKVSDTQKLDAIVDFFEARTFIDKPVRRLSSGQLQLTLLMSCFMSDKELLLLDEPFQFLSLRQRDKVSEYLQGYLKPGITLVLITHYDQDLARWTENTMRL